jgi:hypothetical protein
MDNKMNHRLSSFFTLSFVLFFSLIIAQAVPSVAESFVGQTIGCAPDAIVCRVSVASDGTEGDGDSGTPEISDDGRYVVFFSTATTLVANDTNGKNDIFVHDRQTGTTMLVSISSGGIQANQHSDNPSVSADGRYIAFESAATNLVSGDTNEQVDIFVHDILTRTTSRVSVSSTGEQADGTSVRPAVSSTGRYVTFQSMATNLVTGDTGYKYDIFVHDRQTGLTNRVSINSYGIQGNDHSDGPSPISADGRFIAFRSFAGNLVTGDTNGVSDLFVHDRQTGSTSRISVSSSGVQANGHPHVRSMSDDGRYVVFQSFATTLVPGVTNINCDTNNDHVYDNPCGHVYLHDRATGTTEIVSTNSNEVQGQDQSSIPNVSADGRYVSFYSRSTNLAFEDMNGFGAIFVRDLQGGTTRLASVKWDASLTYSLLSSISSNGTFIAYMGFSSDIVPGDTNFKSDIFVVNTARLPLTNNGHFNIPISSGTGDWTFFANPANAGESQLSNGVFEFKRNVGSQQVVLLQNTGIPLAANTGLNVQLDLGNSSANRKRVSVLVHDGSFTDLQICTFWLPPNAPFRTYTMQARTSQAWTNASLSIYANSADGAGWYRVDNVTMTQMQTTPPASTLCTDPSAPAAPGGADGANLVLNGDFVTTIPMPSGNPAVGNWWSYAGITWQQVGGELQTYRPSGTPPGGVMIQNTGAAVPLGMPLEATMQLGNNSATYRYVKVLLHDADFSDFGVCAFWLPPNTPLGNYTMRTYTTEAWTNATVAIYPNPAYPSGWIRTDNVTLRQRPGLTLTGTGCYEPGAPIPAPAAPFADATMGEAAPTLGDMLPPGELPLMVTPAPLEPQSAADGEGEFSE